MTSLAISLILANRFSRLKALTLLTSHPDPEYDRIEWVPMLPVDSIRSDSISVSVFYFRRRFQFWFLFYFQSMPVPGSRVRLGSR